MKPKYPIYIPSKNRADVCYTANCFLRDGVDFKLVVEPSQFEKYRAVYDEKLILVLPADGMRLLGSRLWIREHSIKAGFDRHWQFDDNIENIKRLHNGKRIECNANIAIKVVEDFTDRYENVGVSGFNYTMFVMNHTQKPYVLNCHVYSASLINNRMPYKWRLYYNDDTDLCLQVLTGGMCTIAVNAFNVKKKQTMTVKGGNTHDLYLDDGRLKMARVLEAMWPDHVEVKWRFGRPQHVVKNNWRHFTHPLIRRKDIDWKKLQQDQVNDYGLQLVAKDEIKSESLKRFYQDQATGKTM